MATAGGMWASLTSCYILFIHLFENKLPEGPEYAKMQFNRMT